MKYSEFAEKISEAYKGKFKHSKCDVQKVKCLGRAIWITCYLSENLNEVSNGYLANDMFKVEFTVDLPGNFDFETDDLPDTMTLKNLSKWYAIRPENSYVYFGRRNLTYRKTSGNAEKLITTFGKFVDRLYKQVCDDVENGNIHGEYVTLIGGKI